jgi:hypothetical protein
MIWVLSLNKDFNICYNGLPIKPRYKGRVFNWVIMFQALKSLEKDDNENKYLYIDGWRFDVSYGLMYLKESRHWNYYLPPEGVEDKLILDVGGGCGETAKFFLEHGALRVDIIEMNKECEKFLEYNSLYHNIGYRIKKFNLSDISKDKYDLIKIDIEGYETELIPYLDWINMSIVLESHSQYITDKFIEKGFNYVNPIQGEDLEIYGGVTQLCRWKK